MDMNRLLGNIDGALDRALRSRKLEFQLMCAAAESRRAAKEIQDETSTEEEETEYEDGGKEDEKKTITTLGKPKGSRQRGFGETNWFNGQKNSPVKRFEVKRTKLESRKRRIKVTDTRCL